jgi:hypothetical protein
VQTATSNSPQATTLATSAIAALAGSASISDVTLTGTATRTAGSGVENGNITLMAYGNSYSSMSLVASDGTFSEIRNLDAFGNPQGFWSSPGGTYQPMVNHNCLTDAAWFFPVLTVLSQISSPDVTAIYVGQETRNNESVQHLQFTRQLPSVASNGSTSATASAFVTSLTAEDVYLDSNSLLPVAILFNAHPDNNAAANILVEVDYSNYQPSGGVQVPFRIQELLNNSLFLDFTIQSVSLNSGLSAANFRAQ